MNHIQELKNAERTQVREFYFLHWVGVVKIKCRKEQYCKQSWVSIGEKRRYACLSAYKRLPFIHVICLYTSFIACLTSQWGLELASNIKALKVLVLIYHKNSEL